MRQTYSYFQEMRRMLKAIVELNGSEKVKGKSKLKTKTAKPKKCLVLGLSSNNLRKIQEGQPLVVQNKIDGLDLEIMIFAGETEMSMARELQEFIGPNTKVYIDPKLRD